MGLAYRTLGKHDEAEAPWKRLLDACTCTEGTIPIQGFYRSLNNLSRLFTITRRDEKAKLNFERALTERKD